MAKTRGSAAAPTRQAPRDIDPQPRQGDRLEEPALDEAAIEPATQPIVAEGGADPVGLVQVAMERPGVNDRSGATDEEIARRAYDLYVARGGTHGADMDDWFQAEQELRVSPSESYDSPSDLSDERGSHRPID